MVFVLSCWRSPDSSESCHVLRSLFRVHGVSCALGANKDGCPCALTATAVGGSARVTSVGF